MYLQLMWVNLKIGEGRARIFLALKASALNPRRVILFIQKIILRRV